MVRGNQGDDCGADVTVLVLLEDFDAVVAVLVVVAEKAWTRSPPWKKKASRWIINSCSIRIVIVIVVLPPRGKEGAVAMGMMHVMAGVVP
jgi:hypothetical protein